MHTVGRLAVALFLIGVVQPVSAEAQQSMAGLSARP
jgi:hypothetical protein